MKPRRPNSMIKARPETTVGAMEGSSATTWKNRRPGRSM